LVTLIKTCIVAIIPFTTYLVIWELAFVMLYQLSGIKAPAREGLGDGFLLMLMYVWQNSIGNINDPDPSTFPE
jgi:hypothetical protein